MLRKEKIAPGEYYHIYCRTILKLPEFEDFNNGKRLVQNFLLANSTSSGEAFEYLRNNKDNPNSIEKAIEIAEQGEKLSDILCYAIMPDHYHLLIKEIRENGITDFIRRCNTSIAKYINIKNERKGPLFESNFKSKHINSNKYLLHLSVYIHLNPLDFLIGKEWRIHELNGWDVSREKLLNYPWSSLKYFLKNGHKNRVLSGTEIILDQFENGKDYENFLREWSESETEELKNFILE